MYSIQTITQRSKIHIHNSFCFIPVSRPTCWDREANQANFPPCPAPVFARTSNFPATAVLCLRRLIIFHPTFVPPARHKTTRLNAWELVSQPNPSHQLMVTTLLRSN